LLKIKNSFKFKKINKRVCGRAYLAALAGLVFFLGSSLAGLIFP